MVGADGGIGREVVSQLRTEGFGPVATVDQRGEVDHLIDVSDLRDGSAYRRWTDSLEDDGIPDVIAWTVGIYPRTEPARYDARTIGDVVDTNLTSFLVFAAALARVQRRDSRTRRLVVVGSQAGNTGGTDAVYAASKAGLGAAVKSLAREFASLRLIANVVSPGPTDTSMAAVMGDRRAHYESTIPLGRFNDPREVAQVVVWLLANAPAALHGTAVDVDGGLVRR